jgi:hypothetical protein
MLLLRHQVAPCLNHFKTIDVPIRFSCSFCASVAPKLLHMGLVVIRKLVSPAVPPEPCMMIWLYQIKVRQKCLLSKQTRPFA